MMKKFLSRDGRLALIETLGKQRVLEGVPSEFLAKLAGTVTLKQLRRGQRIIRQDDQGKELFFVLCGDGLQIFINNRPHVIRECGELVGEMAMLVKNGKTSACVRAAGPTVVAQIDYQAFTKLARQYHGVWLGIARLLAERLQQRNRHIRLRKAIPRVFVGSSSERKVDAELARDKLKTRLGTGVEVVLWSDKGGVFELGSTTMADLVGATQGFDFGLFIFAPDDRLRLRKFDYRAVRDNVLLELGLFMGAFSDPKRALILRPNTKKVRLPSDLLGMTVLQYDPRKKEASIDAAMEEFASVIEANGPR